MVLCRTLYITNRFFDENYIYLTLHLPSIIPLYLGLAVAVNITATVDVGVYRLGGIAFDVTAAVDRGVDV